MWVHYFIIFIVNFPSSFSLINEMYLGCQLKFFSERSFYSSCILPYRPFFLLIFPVNHTTDLYDSTPARSHHKWETFSPRPLFFFLVRKHFTYALALFCYDLFVNSFIRISSYFVRKSYDGFRLQSYSNKVSMQKLAKKHPAVLTIIEESSENLLLDLLCDLNPDSPSNVRTSSSLYVSFIIS